MRILLTGGAGFIGSHVADRLVERGHEVVVVDRLHPRAHSGRPGYLRSDVRYLEAGLDAATLEEALAGVDAVCHQAAMVGLGAVRPGPRDPARLEAGRFELTCPRCGAELAPVAVAEDAPADPRNVYAATKLHQEHLAFASM